MFMIMKLFFIKAVSISFWYELYVSLSCVGKTIMFRVNCSKHCMKVVATYKKDRKLTHSSPSTSTAAPAAQAFVVL